MSIMIACSPSTGSSLLRRMLNRHSQIFCGSETHLLCKEKLYLNWSQSKKRLVNPVLPGLVDKAWLHFRGIQMDEEYTMDKMNWSRMVDSSRDFNEFLQNFFNHQMANTSKRLWIEKTPSNALCAGLFLDHIPNSKLVIIYRSPYDILASLLRRGLSHYESFCRFFLVSAFLLRFNEHNKCHIIKYEDMVSDPVQSLGSLLDFLGLDFESSMLNSESNETGTTYMEGWNYAETDAIGKGSINSFNELSDEDRVLFGTLIKNLKLKDTALPDFRDICQDTGYDFFNIESNTQVLNKALKAMMYDRFIRTIKMSYFNHFNYPYSID